MSFNTRYTGTCMRVASLTLTLFSLVFSLLPWQSNAYAADELEVLVPGQRGAYAVVNGQEVAITQGSVLGQAVLDPINDMCVVTSPIDVGVDSGNDTTYTIDWGFDTNCRAVVTGVSPGVSEGSRPGGAEESTLVPEVAGIDPNPYNLIPDVAEHNGNAAHRHRGWTKFTIFEQYGITATEAFAEMQHWQKPRTPNCGRDCLEAPAVYGGHDPDPYCDHSNYPTWRTLRNEAHWWPYGFDWVKIKAYCKFHHVDTNIRYEMVARWITTAGHGWDGRCTLTEGAIPRTWDYKCRSFKTLAY